MFGYRSSAPLVQTYQQNSFESQNYQSDQNMQMQNTTDYVQAQQYHSQPQQQQQLGRAYYGNAQSGQLQKFAVEESENDNVIQPEMDEQQQHQQPMQQYHQNMFEFSTTKNASQQPFVNQGNGSAETLYLQQGNPRYSYSNSDLEESKNPSNNLLQNNKKITEGRYTCGKQIRSAQDLVFQQAQNNMNLPQEKQEEQTDEEEQEERKGEKKLSPLKSCKKSIQKEKKQALHISQVKQNSSCQLSQHSSSSNTTSSSLSRDSLTSSSSSSSHSLHNQGEEGTEHQINNPQQFDYSLVPISKTIQERNSISAFGDCHVELSIEREDPAEHRFISFKYWRPCQNYVIDQNSQIANFFCEPNFSSRSSDFSACIQVYKNYPEQNINRWGHVLDMYQKWTSILYSEADYFFKKLNSHPKLKQYFEEKMDLFMKEAIKRINSCLLDEQGSSKKQLFCYSLRKLNEEYKDIGSIQYGYSRGLIDILGPDPVETRLYLQRYGLNYFFDQKTRIERYIHDFQYIQQGSQIYDKVNVITIDKIQIELKVTNQYIYYDFFQDPYAKEVFGDFSECMHLVRKFAGCKMEVFEIDSLQQQKLQVERHIYKPIYEKEKYLTFDDQLLALYYKNEIKKFNNPKGAKKPAHKQSSDEEDLMEENADQQDPGNFEEFGYNPFENFMSFEKKEEENQMNFQFDTYNYQQQTSDRQQSFS